MPCYSHPNDLRDAGAAHVADSRSSQIVKLQLGYLSGLARGCPRCPKMLDRRTGAVEHIVATVRIIASPLQPGAHVPANDRHRPRVSALRLLGAERDKPLPEIDLVPSPCQQFAQADPCEIRGDK